MILRKTAWDHPSSMYTKFSVKLSSLTPLIHTHTCSYQRVKNAFFVKYSVRFKRLITQLAVSTCVFASCLSFFTIVSFMLVISNSSPANIQPVKSCKHQLLRKVKNSSPATIQPVKSCKHKLLRKVTLKIPKASISFVIVTWLIYESSKLS